jgi:hypothetical protein
VSLTGVYLVMTQRNTLTLRLHQEWDDIHKAPVGARAAGDYIRMRVQTFKPEK